MPSLLRHALRETRWAVLGWSLGLFALGLLLMAFYPSVRDNPALQDYYNTFPEAFRNALGANRPINTLPGYLGAELGVYGPVLLAIYAIIQGTRALAGEEQEGTLDLTLAQPVPRWRFAAAKHAAQLAGIATLAVALGLGLWLGSLLFPADARLGPLLAMALEGAPLAAAVGALTLLASAVGHRRGLPILVGSLFTVASFFLNALAPLRPDTRTLQKASLFYHYHRSDAYGGHWDATYLALSAVLAVACGMAAAAWFHRKDIKA